MFLWFVGWVVIAAIVAWITGILWRNPRGCLVDGALSLVGMFVGVIAYGLIAGSPQFLEMSFFSVAAGVIVAVLALVIGRAATRAQEARTEAESSAAAEGWEAEDASPAPEEPLSERPREEAEEPEAGDLPPPRR
jgi:hypothetical protein